jgi:citrate lyase subunit beta/citryl-CoA lyase
MFPMLRSLLFVPATHPGRFQKALDAGADAVVFDLEDAVEPARKDEARQNVRRFFGGLKDAGADPRAHTQRLVRVNPSGSAWQDDDLALVAATAAVDGIVVPKVSGPEDLAAVAIAAGSRPVFPLLETARGILAADAMAGAAPPVRLGALLFGAEDLTAEIGIARTIDGDELIYARSRVVLAATAAGVDAIDAVFTRLDDDEGLRRDAARARAIGFAGKMTVHPRQIAIVHDIFSPGPDEIARAERLIAAFEAAQAAGEGVARIDNQMVDAPVVARARRILSRGQ